MSKKTHAEHVAEIAAKNPNVEVLGEIIKAHAKVLYRCKICSHEWNVAPHTLKMGRGCPECKKVKVSNAKRLTHTEQVGAINKVNPDVDVLGEITGNDVKVLCRCKICGYKWAATPHSLKSGEGCPECGKIKRANKRRLTHDEQVAAIAKVNPNVEVLEGIKGDAIKVLCCCKVCHHEWETTPNHLKSGGGCPECKKVISANARKLPHTKHVADIKKANPNIEILEEIKSTNKKVLCRCLVCGYEWGAKPSNLKRGRGCPCCAKTGFLAHKAGKLYIMVDDLNVPTMMKIGVSVKEEVRRRDILNSAHKAGVFIPALYVTKTWEGPTELMQRIEQMMHENYAEWNIKFPAKFDGCTEFFYYTPETAGVFDAVNEIYYTVVNHF